MQNDLGEATSSEFEWTDFLDTPPAILLNSSAKSRASQMRLTSRLSRYVLRVGSLPAFVREGDGPYGLFEVSCNDKGEREETTFRSENKSVAKNDLPESP